MHAKFLYAGIATLALAVWVAALVATSHAVTPRLINTFYTVDRGVPTPFEFPLSVESTGGHALIEFDLISPLGYRPVLWFGADDCIVNISINGRSTVPQDVSFPYCISEPQAFRFGGALDGPLNHFIVTLEDGGGLMLLRVSLSKTDPLRMLFWVLGIAGVVAWLWACRRLLGWHRTDIGIASFFLFGVLLRCLYLSVTPPDVRSHEWDKHLDYVRHVAEHFTVPNASAGWEFHQPPFYYFIAGSWVRIAEAMHRNIGAILHDLQILSLILSVLTLLLGVAIAYVVYRKASERQERLVFVAVMSVFPTLVMFSSRITNDVLAQTLAFLFLLLLLRWWQNKKTGDFILLTLTIAVSLVTKVSALLFLGITAVVLAVAPGIRTAMKLKLGIGMLVCCIIVAGWLPVLRYVVETDTTRSRVLGNEGMNELVHTDNDPAKLFTFNPIEVLRHPYNDPDTDTFRRQYFPEYFFKSAFFGEFFRYPFHFRIVTFLMLLLGMACLPLILFGVLSSVRFPKEFDVPMSLTLLAAIAGAIAYRVLFPYIPNQDFRFVTFIIVPCVFFVLAGGQALPPPVRRFFHSILWALVVVCALFFLKLAFQ